MAETDLLLRWSLCLGLVGPDRLGFFLSHSFSPFRSAPGFNRYRSSSSRTESSHWTRTRGARNMLSLSSNGANFPQAAARVLEKRPQKWLEWFHFVLIENRKIKLSMEACLIIFKLCKIYLWSLLSLGFL